MRHRLPTFPPSLTRMVMGMVGGLLVLLFIILIYSIFQSGYNFQFDIDELGFSQTAYLMANGWRPYIDIANGIYSPMLQWLTMPVFKIYGFSFEGLYATKYVLMAMFLLRFAALFFFVRLVFNTKTAVLFLPLALLDPYIVVSGMQYRPDNLMLLFASLGMVSLAYAFKRKSQWLFFISGICFSLSIYTLPKLMATVGMMVGVSLVFLIWRKHFRLAAFFIAGGFLPWGIFFLFLLKIGAIGAFFQQLEQMKNFYTSFEFPLPMYIMVKPDNPGLFGSGGKPITWVYEWMLPALGMAGLFNLIEKIADQKQHGTLLPARIALALALPLQWLPLFALQVVFLQHYMTVNWLHALLAAVAVASVHDKLQKSKIVGAIATMVVIGTLSYISIKSIGYNLHRATFTSDNLISGFTQRWKQIPANEPIFPGYLFRPQIYPIIFGSPMADITDEMYATLPDIPTLLESKKPKVLLDEWTLVRMPQKAQEYIRSHYDRIPGDPALMLYKQ